MRGGGTYLLQCSILGQNAGLSISKVKSGHKGSNLEKGLDYDLDMLIFPFHSLCFLIDFNLR